MVDIMTLSKEFKIDKKILEWHFMKAAPELICGIDYEYSGGKYNLLEPGFICFIQSGLVKDRVALLDFWNKHYVTIERNKLLDDLKSLVAVYDNAESPEKSSVTKTEKSMRVNNEIHELNAGKKLPALNDEYREFSVQIRDMIHEEVNSVESNPGKQNSLFNHILRRTYQVMEKNNKIDFAAGAEQLRKKYGIADSINITITKYRIAIELYPDIFEATINSVCQSILH